MDGPYGSSAGPNDLLRASTPGDRYSAADLCRAPADDFKAGAGPQLLLMKERCWLGVRIIVKLRTGLRECQIPLTRNLEIRQII